MMTTIGSLRNDYSEGNDNSWVKTNLHFPYKSRNYLDIYVMSFLHLQLHVDVIEDISTALILKYKNLAVVTHVVWNTWNLPISCCCFPEDGEEI